MPIITVPGAREPKLLPADPRLRLWADAIARAIDPARIRADVERLPGPRNRLRSTDAMVQADAMLLQHFGAAGWKAERLPFTFDNVPGYLDDGKLDRFSQPTVFAHLEGANIVAVKEGDASRDSIVVLGHYDTVQDTGGANDNTASVAVIMELARVLASQRFRRTIILALTDMEELGLFGARAFVSALKQQERRVLGAINFDTMGYTSAEPNTQFLPPGIGFTHGGLAKRIQNRQWKGDFTAIIYSGGGTTLAVSFASALVRLAGEDAALMLRDPNDLPVVGGLLGRTMLAVRHFARSDQVPFWETGIPAILISDTANFRYKHYHQSTDTPEKLDYARLAAIAGASAAVIAQVAELIQDGDKPPG